MAAQAKTGWQINLPKETWRYCTLFFHVLQYFYTLLHSFMFFYIQEYINHSESVFFQQDDGMQCFLPTMAVRSKLHVLPAASSKDWITIRKEAAPSDATGAKSLLFSGGPTKKQPGTQIRGWSLRRQIKLLVQREYSLMVVSAVMIVM